MKKIALLAACILSLMVFGCSAAGPGTGTGNNSGEPRFDTPPDTENNEAPAGNFDGNWSSEAGDVQMTAADGGKVAGSWKDGTFDGQWSTSATGVTKINYTWYHPSGAKGGSGWWELRDCDDCKDGIRLSGEYTYTDGSYGGPWTLVRK